jgi:hypothetical protein
MLIYLLFVQERIELQLASRKERQCRVASHIKKCGEET